MNSNLEKKLYDNYPELFFTFNDMNPQLSLMWGIECEDGWYNIIDSLCQQIVKPYREKFNKAKNEKEYEKAIYNSNVIPTIVQIKEKWGSLRIYAINTTKEQEILIDFAENFSLKICEFCGTSEDVVSYKKGWHKTLCKEHANVFYGNLKED